MRITNKAGLPPAFVHAVTPRDPVPGKYHVTELLNGTRQIYLMRKHWDQLEDDAANRLWAILGTAVHMVLSFQPEHQSEFRETTLTEYIGAGLSMVGTFDSYDGSRRIITDYKTSSVWKAVYDDYSRDEEQTYLYSILLQRAGFDAHSAELVYMMRDHSIRKARTERDYPPLPVKVHQIKLDPYQAIKAWNKAVARAHAVERALTVDAMPPRCTPEERWHKPDTYAVKKKGNKGAWRVYEELHKAEETAEEMNAKGKGEYIIEEREGEDTRCMDYCPACKFCPHWQTKYKGE